VGIVLALAAGLVLRVLVDSPLWLDEALSVNIARLPVPDLLDALRRDGSPPLYYLLLHVWVGWFGTGDAAARSLSVVFSVATLPLAWLAGRRLGGHTSAWAAVLLLAASPFAVRYASETRMYALLMLLAVGAWLALTASLVRPTVPRLAALGLVTGLLALTHYWALYLVAAMFLAACWLTRDGGTRPAALRVVGAMAAGGLLFVPWLPSFVFQARHTGTPWGDPGGMRIFRYALEGWSGGRGPVSVALAAILCVLAAAAVLRRRRGDRDPALVLAWLVAGTLGIAAAAELAVGVSFALRYTAIVFPLFVLLAAVGAHRIPGRRSGSVLVAAGTVVSLVAAVPNVRHLRTNAAAVARAVASGFRPGDVVVYCPDQLGPAISRLLPASVPQVTFPDRGDPHLVNWVDYHDRHRARPPQSFARELSASTGPGGRVWLVYAWQYRVAGSRCTDVADALTRLRTAPTTVVRPDPAAYERARLLLYPAVQP
jgi:uncharacterized membrane protein